MLTSVLGIVNQRRELVLVFVLDFLFPSPGFPPLAWTYGTVFIFAASAHRVMTYLLLHPDAGRCESKWKTKEPSSSPSLKLHAEASCVRRLTKCHWSVRDSIPRDIYPLEKQRHGLLNPTYPAFQGISKLVPKFKSFTFPSNSHGIVYSRSVRYAVS